MRRKWSALLPALVFMLFCLPVTAYAEAVGAFAEPTERPATEKPENWNETEQAPADKVDDDDPQDTEDLDTKPDNRIEKDTEESPAEETPALDNDANPATNIPPELPYPTLSPTEPDTAYNWNELQTWLDEHEDTGGTVTLGADIEITEYGYITTWADNLTVNTGAYGFVVSGGLMISDSVHISGEGMLSPVIRVLEGGWLYFNGGACETAATIAVTGEGGHGIILESGADCSVALNACVKLWASGADAVALESDVELDLRCLFIEAAGDGAQGLISTQPVKLYLSHIIADGAAVTAPETTLDTCVVSPDVPGACAISRRAVALRPTMPIFVELGEGIPGQFLDFGPMRCCMTLRAEGVEDESETVWAGFDDSVLPYDIPGRHFLPGSLPPPYDLFDLVTEEYPLGIAVTVFDPLVPCYEDFNVCSGVCTISYIYMGEIADLTLWRSDDEGTSWYVCWRDGDSAKEDFCLEYDGRYLSLQFHNRHEFVTPALLALETGEGMGASVLRVRMDEGRDTGLGGDRDGGDRVTLLPWEVFANHNSGGSLETFPAEPESGDNPGAHGSGGSSPVNNANDDNGDDNGDDGIGNGNDEQLCAGQDGDLLVPAQHDTAMATAKPDLTPEAVPQDSSRSATAQSETFDGATLVLEPSSPFIPPETMAPGFTQDTEPASETTVFPNRDDFPAEQGSDPDAGQPPSLIPPIAVTASIFGAGGAGWLALLFRRKRVLRRR